MSGLLDARAMEVLGLVLLHSLWQGVVVATVATLVLAFVRRAAARYRVACLALLALLAWPTVTGFDLALREPRPTSARAIVAAASVGGEASFAEATPARMRAVAEGATAPAERDRDVGAAPPVTEPAPAPPEGLRARLVPLLAIVWCTGVLVGLARLTLGLTSVARLRRSGRPAEREIAASVREIARRMGLRVRVAVLETHRLTAPVVIGVVRPALLLPLGLAARLPHAQLEAVLAHELAHVLRRDYLVNLLQRLAETLLFHHPAAWWLSSVVRTEREHLCDDAAVGAVGGDPLPLARALATLERGRSGAPIAAMGAQGSRGTPGDLLGRVRRLLGRDAARQRPHLAPLALQATLPALLLAAVALFAPAVAQVGQEAPTVQPDGRYGVLVHADGTQDAYVQVARPAEGEGIVPRLVTPDGELQPGSDLRTTREAWSVHAPRDLGKPLLIELEDGRVELPLEDAVRLVPPRPSIDPGTSPTPIYGEAGRIVGWTDEAVPSVVWEAVPGAAAYHVVVNHRRDPDGARIFHPDDRFILGEGATFFTLGGLEPGTYFVRVHAFSDHPRLPEGGGLRRVDEAISETVTLHWNPLRRGGTNAAPPARAESDPMPLVGEPAVAAEWVEGRLVVQLPSLDGVEVWDVDLRPQDPDEVGAPSVGTFLPGTQTRVELVRAEEIPPGVPYLVEVRALANVPEGTPVDEVPALATSFVGPIERPEPAGDEPLVRVRLGRYAGPSARSDLRLELEGSYLLEEGDEVVLLAPDGEVIDRHFLDPGAMVGTETPWARAGAYRVRLERAGETLEEHTVRLPAREPLPRPAGLRFDAATAATPTTVLAPEPGGLSWDAVEGADRYLVEVELSDSMSRGLWVEEPHVDLADLLADAGPGSYEVQVTAYRSEADRDEAAGIRDASASDRVAFEVVAEESVPDTVAAPFRLRYGNHFDEASATELFLHLDLAPEGGASVAPAVVRILDAAGAPLTTFDVTAMATMGGFPVDPAQAAALEVTTAGGSWTVPLDVPPAPEGFAPIEVVRVEDADVPGGAVLAWDPVPGATLYEVGMFPTSQEPGRLVNAAEPWIALAGLEPGGYDVRIWAYTRDPSTPARVLATNLAVAHLGEIHVPPSVAAPTSEPGAVQGVVRVGSGPAAGVAVGLTPFRSPTDVGPQETRTAVTGADGRYRFDDVPPGRYSASVRTGPLPNAAPVRIPTAPLAVAAGRTTVATDVHAVPTIEPRGVLASGTAASGEVPLAWEPVAGAATYLLTLRERTTPSEAWEAETVLAATRVEEPRWTVRLQPGRVHEVEIEALDADGHRVGRVGLELRTTPSR